MNPTIRRRIRWAFGGAFTLAILAIILGSLFSVLIAVADNTTPTDAGAGFWLGLLLRSALLWGGGALPFGAALGFYASMIWREPE
ncbi:MAG: ABC transporter ATP-binding protein [Oscillochloris sp.]|nr:ABC transporter ATP-binding protein [Oscillochloris sp.]